MCVCVITDTSVLRGSCSLPRHSSPSVCKNLFVMYTYVYTDIHVGSTQSLLSLYIHAYMYIHAIHRHTHTQYGDFRTARVYIHTYIYTYINIITVLPLWYCKNIHTHIHIYVYMYIHINHSMVISATRKIHIHTYKHTYIHINHSMATSAPRDCF